jgi:hypothetical protein
LGGENTKFFHAKATERYRQNTITQIANEDGVILTDHQQKASPFWQSFKDRMGVAIPTATPFNLTELLQPIDNLSHLCDPFSMEENEGIVKYMKIDKAPGPDGFNGLFMKKYWPIIKSDFINLCNNF